jgi:hypothetical protein
VLRDDFFYGGATIGDLLIAPIPSSLFPDKPTTARDQMLIKAYGGPCGFAEGGVCPDFSAIGTFYQDFAWPGVLFGMAVLGALSRAVWARYKEDPRSVTRVIVAAIWSVSLPIMIRAGVMPALAWCLYFLLPSLAIARLAQAMATRFPNPRTELLEDALSATSPAGKHASVDVAGADDSCDRALSGDCEEVRKPRQQQGGPANHGRRMGLDAAREDDRAGDPD